MPTYLSCSIIGYSSQSLYDYEKKLAIPTNAQPGVPNRIVSKSSITQPPFDTQAIYSFERTELNNILDSPDIKAFDLIPSIEDELEDFFFYTGSPNPLDIDGTGSAPVYALFTESFLDQGRDLGYLSEESRQYGRFPYVSQLTNNFYDSSKKSTFRPYSLAYNTTSDPNLLFSGSEGGGYPNTVNTFISNSISAIPNFPTRSFWDLYQEGEGVDIVNFEPATILHPNYFDENGKCRIQLINWYKQTGQLDRISEQPKYMYHIPGVATSLNPFFPHGDMTLSLAGGTVTSFAPKAKLYILNTQIASNPSTTSNFYFHFLEGMDLLKRFHESKSIDPNTGYKRPTIANMSRAFATVANSSYYTYPSSEENAALRASGSASFELGDLHENDGILIEYKTRYFLIVSASEENTLINTKLPYKNKLIGSSLIVNTYSGSRENIVDAINNLQISGEPNRFFLTCSLVGNTFSVTSSFASRKSSYYSSAQMAPYFIYTGSYNPAEYSIGPGGYTSKWLRPFFIRSGTNIEETGSLVLSSSFPSEIGNRITSIVVNGVEQVTGGQDNYLTSDHLLPTGEPVDLMGKRDITKYNGTVETSNNSNVPSLLYPQYEVQRNSFLDAMYQVADAGVIFCVSAGNRGNYITHSGSANDKFFDSRNYAPELADNYFVKNVDTGNPPYSLSGSRNYYNRSIFSNGAAIHVGVINLIQKGSIGWNVSGSYPYQRLDTSTNRGPGVDVYMPSEGMWFASPNYRGNYPTPSSNFIPTHSLLADRFYDSQSVIDTISESFSQLYTGSNSSGRPYWINEFHQGFIANSGGTSASSPMFAGMAALIAERYPGIDVRGVRNFIHDNMPRVFTSATGSYTHPEYVGWFRFDDTGSMFSNSVAKSGSRQMGEDGIIGYLPMNEVLGEITGSELRIEGVDFKM